MRPWHRQSAHVERRAKIHMLYNRRIVGLRRCTNSNPPADLQNPRQLEIPHNGRRPVARCEIMPQAEGMTDFVRHDVPQVIVLLFEISIHHGLGQNEDVRVERFLLHVLPKGFVRIRDYGWMANRGRREHAQLCRSLLEAEPLPSAAAISSGAQRRCPICGGAVEVVEMIVPRELSRPRLSRRREPDSS
jgi:hypothetical protein